MTWTINCVQGLVIVPPKARATFSRHIPEQSSNAHSWGLLFLKALRVVIYNTSSASVTDPKSRQNPPKGLDMGRPVGVSFTSPVVFPRMRLSITRVAIVRSTLVIEAEICLQLKHACIDWGGCQSALPAPPRESKHKACSNAEKFVAVVQHKLKPPRPVTLCRENGRTRSYGSDDPWAGRTHHFHISAVERL